MDPTGSPKVRDSGYSQDSPFNILEVILPNLQSVNSFSRGQGVGEGETIKRKNNGKTTGLHSVNTDCVLSSQLCLSCLPGLPGIFFY